jgi:hypothetical protein
MHTNLKKQIELYKLLFLKHTFKGHTYIGSNIFK